MSTYVSVTFLMNTVRRDCLKVCSVCISVCVSHCVKTKRTHNCCCFCPVTLKDSFSCSLENLMLHVSVRSTFKYILLRRRTINFYFYYKCIMKGSCKGQYTAGIITARKTGLSVHLGPNCCFKKNLINVNLSLTGTINLYLTS